MKKIAVRLLLVWVFLGQMLCVCLPARTTRHLSRLESLYAFRPSAGNQAALQNEFDREVDYQSKRAIARFSVVLLVDVGVILLGWKIARSRKAAPKDSAVPTAVPCSA